MLNINEALRGFSYVLVPFKYFSGDFLMVQTRVPKLVWFACNNCPKWRGWVVFLIKEISSFSFSERHAQKEVKYKRGLAIFL